MQEYKGIYYGEEKEQKFYEGGAHFKYESLYRILEFLASQQSSYSRRHFNDSPSLKKQQISIKIHKDSSNLKKSRNILNFSYINKSNFETQTKKKNDSCNSKNNKKRSFLESKIKSNSTYAKKKFIPKKNIISRNVDSTTFKGKPNTMLSKKIQNIIIHRKNGKSISSLDKNKSLNKSSNKHINKSQSKSKNSNYKTNFDNLRNIFYNNKSDLTEKKYTKKIKVDMKRLQNLLRTNISSLEEESNNNINNNKIKSGNKTNRLSDNRIKFRNNNNLNHSIINNSALTTNNNKIKLTEKNNLTQKPKIKVKNMIKDNNITKSNNLQTSMELFNIKFKNKQKSLYNTSTNGQKKNNQSNITNNKTKINNISYATIIPNKNGIESYKQKTNNKIPLTNKKIYKLNNNMSNSKDINSSNNQSKQLTKIKHIGVSDKNCITSRENIHLHSSNNCSTNAINSKNNINYSSEKPKFFKNTIKKHEKLNGDKKQNKDFNTINYKELITHRISKKPKKHFK